MLQTRKKPTQPDVTVAPVVELELLGELVDVMRLKSLDDLPLLADLLRRRQELLDEEKGRRAELATLPERRRAQERHAARALAAIGELVNALEGKQLLPSNMSTYPQS